MTTFARALSAEVVRSRHTFGARLWLVGLAVALLQCLGWAVAGDHVNRTWDQLLAWQVLYATGLAGGLAGLVAALAERREQAHRSGGTPWRGAPRAAVRAARFVVLAGQLAALTAALVLPMLATGALLGVPGLPVARVVGLTAVLWVGALPWLMLGALVATRFGLYAAVGLAFVGHIAGTVRAEAATWWAEPWTWGVRGALPLLHTHANGVPAGPQEAVRHLPILPPVLLALALSAALGAAAVAARPASTRAHRAEAAPSAPATAPGARVAVGDEPVRRGRRRAVAAAAGSLRAWWMVVLPVTTLVLVTGTRLLWPPAYAHGLTSLVVVPGLTCLLACLVTRAQAPALRVILTRVGAATWAAATFFLLGVVVVPLVVWGALLSGGRAGSLLVVGTCSSLALLFFSLWLATRFGVGVALGVIIVGWVWSLLVGGSQLAEGPILWLLGPWAYAYSATSGDRMVTAAALALLVAPMAAYAWVRAVRRAAAYA